MSFTRLLLPAVAVLAATTVAAGCGGTRSGAPVATTNVSMAKSYRFAPTTIEIKAGTYHYTCTLHSHDMKGTVIVT